MNILSITIKILLLSFSLNALGNIGNEIGKWSTTRKNITTDIPVEVKKFDSSINNPLSGDDIIYLINDGSGDYIYKKYWKEGIKNPYPNLLTDVTFVLNDSNDYYICSKHYQMFKMKYWSKPFKIDNPPEIKKSEEQYVKLRCFDYRIINIITVGFINSSYVFNYNYKTGEWKKTRDFGHKIYSITFEDYTVNPTFYYVFYSEKSTYYVTKIKYDNGNSNDIKKAKIPIDNKPYTINELSMNYPIGYIFSYEAGTNLFFYYKFDMDKGIILYYGGNWSLKSFDSFTFISVKFIESTGIIYYSIKHSKTNEYFIGALDLNYPLFIYHSEVSQPSNLHFPMHYLKGSQQNLEYTYGKSLFSICVFAGTGTDCKYQYNKYLYIANNTEGLFYNKIRDNCPSNSKKLEESYCIEKCPVGFVYRPEKDDCYKCGKYFKYMNKTCSDTCDSIFDKNNVCYDCLEFKKIYYEYSCINSCDEVYAEHITTNNTCKNCLKNNMYFDTYDKKCTNNCDGGEYNKLTGECKICKKYGQYYLNNRCLDSCPTYFIPDQQNICKTCPENTLYQKGKCVDKCEVGRGLYNATVEILNKNILVCEYCKNISTFLFDGKCYEKCPYDNHLVDENNVCYLCEEHFPDRVFNQNGSCVSNCSRGNEQKTIEKIFENKTHIENYCMNCKENGLYFNHKNKCVTNCEERSMFYNDTNICYFCNETENTKYFEVDHCVSNCSRGYGPFPQLICEFCKDKGLFYEDGECLNKCHEYRAWNESDNICVTCRDYNLFFERNRCVNNCSRASIKDTIYYICTYCKDEKAFFYENSCREDCPQYSLNDTNDNYCYFCSNYFMNYSCVDTCDAPYKTVQDADGHKACIVCGADGKSYYIGGKCTDRCPSTTYGWIDHFCHSCYCNGNAGSCSEKSNKCICKNKNHFYGYSCEFESEIELEKTKLKIIASYDSAISSNKTSFTFNYDEINFSDEDYIIEWKFFLNDMDIFEREEYEKYFVTSNNEIIFSINPGLLKYQNKNELKLTLTNIKTKEIMSHKIKIAVQEVHKSRFTFSIIFSGDVSTTPMTTVNILLMKDDRLANLQERLEYKFVYQNKEKEIIPLTKYSSEIKKRVLSPYVKTFFLYVINDRGEIDKVGDNYIKQNEFLNKTNCDKILNDNTYTETEKIFIFMTWFEAKVQYINLNDFEKFISFLKIRTDFLIKNNGKYNEETKLQSKDRDFLLYTEPKTIFSVINIFIKNQIKIESEIYSHKENVLVTISEFLLNMQENVYKHHLANETNKFYDKEDLKSFFRTIDNLVIFYVENVNERENEEKFFTNIKNCLNLFLRIIGRKTLPSENIRIIGQKITIHSLHFGKYQKVITLPSIKSLNASQRNYTDYILEDINFKSQNCQINTTLFCVNEDNLLKLRKELKEKMGINLEDLILNFYILRDINKGTEFDSGFELVSKEDKIINTTNLTSLQYDFQIPFKNLIFKNIPKLNDISNEKLIKDQIRFLEKNDNIKTFNEEIKNKNFSNITCVPKQYIKSDKHFCYTHFDYQNNIIVCSCNTLGEIGYVNNEELANFYKNIQYLKVNYKHINSFSVGLIVIFGILIALPAIVFIIYDIIDANKIKDDNKEMVVKNNLQIKYLELKKYTRANSFSFAFNITNFSFPILNEFFGYTFTHPKFIKHFFFIFGLNVSLVISALSLFAVLPFEKRQEFIDKRDASVSDDVIHNLPTSLRHVWSSFLTALLCCLILNLFYYILKKYIDYDQNEKEYFKNIKDSFHDYVYNDIKKDVLLGAKWDKLQFRILTFSQICGGYYKKLRKLRSPKNDKYDKYLKYLRLLKEKKNIPIKDLEDPLLDSSEDVIFSKENSSVDVINLSQCSETPLNQNDKIEEQSNADSTLLNQKNFGGYDIDTDLKSSISIKNSLDFRNMSDLGNSLIGGKNFERLNTLNSNIDNINNINNKNNNSIINDTNKKSNNNNSKQHSSWDSLLKSLKEEKQVNLNISNKNIRIIHYNKVHKFEKIRSIYMNKSLKKKLDETEVDSVSSQSENFEINYQDNISYILYDRMDKLDQILGEKFIKKTNFNKFIYIGIILFFIHVLIHLYIFSVFKHILDIYEFFIINNWLIPSIICLIIGNYVMYYLIKLFSSFILFKFYNLRKTNMIIKMLFYIFIDKPMIYLFKIRNYFTKYEQEFKYWD